MNEVKKEWLAMISILMIVGAGYATLMSDVQANKLLSKNNEAATRDINNNIIQTDKDVLTNQLMLSHIVEEQKQVLDILKELRER